MDGIVEWLERKITNKSENIKLVPNTPYIEGVLFTKTK